MFYVIGCLLDRRPGFRRAYWYKHNLSVHLLHPYAICFLFSFCLVAARHRYPRGFGAFIQSCRLISVLACSWLGYSQFPLLVSFYYFSCNSCFGNKAMSFSARAVELWTDRRQV